MQQTEDGGYIMTGRGAGEGSYDEDLFLTRTDPEGSIVWKTSFDGSVGYCLNQTSDGGYIVVGETWLYAKPYRYKDLWLLKFDENGDTLWTKTYGLNKVDRGRWVEQTSDGGYIISGSMDGTGDIGWEPKLWILKTDENGDTLWSKIYDPGPGNGWVGYCIKSINEGYIIATSKGLMRTDSAGDSLWMNPYGSGCVGVTFDGGYITATSHNEDIWLIKTDSLGDTIWTRTYGREDEDFSYCVGQTSDSGYIVVGETYFPESFNRDVWLLKTDADGDTTWTRNYWGDRAEVGRFVQQTIDGGYIISGYSFDMILLIKTDSLGEIGIEEEIPFQSDPFWNVVTAIGPQIVLRYTKHHGGFHAQILDASGRVVDEVKSEGSQGILSWGDIAVPGVYFIRVISGKPTAVRKVILIK